MPTYTYMYKEINKEKYFKEIYTKYNHEQSFLNIKLFITYLWYLNNIKWLWRFTCLCKLGNFLPFAFLIYSICIYGRINVGMYAFKFSGACACLQLRTIHVIWELLWECASFFYYCYFRAFVLTLQLYTWGANKPYEHFYSFFQLFIHSFMLRSNTQLEGIVNAR